MAAGSITEDYVPGTQQSVDVDVVVLAWTSSAGGAVNGILSRKVAGVLAAVEFIPGSGAAQPSNNYDVQVKSEAGFDLLAGRGANRSDSAVERFRPGATQHDGTTASVGDVVVNEQLELDVQNAGDSKTGTVRIYVTK